jgi:hypothetical protein
MTTNVSDVIDAGERHAHVEFLSDDVNGLCHSGFAARGQPEDVGAANQATFCT